MIQQQRQLHQKRQLPDAAATQALGQALAGQLPPGSILLLLGDLGAGKTCLVQGLARGLGIDEPITSPTFALAQHYQGQGGRALVHLDLYRLELAAAADELGATCIVTGHTLDDQRETILMRSKTGSVRRMIYRNPVK